MERTNINADKNTMQTSYKKSGLMLVVASILFLILGGFWFVFQTWMPFMWIILAVSVCLFIMSGIREKKIISDFLSSKSTKNSLSMGSTVLLTLVILIAVNSIGVRHNKYFDLSQNQQMTLSDQTIKVLENINQDIEFKYFYVDGLQTQDTLKKNFTTLLRLYQSFSKRIKFETIEMNKNPIVVKDFGATQGTGEAFVRIGSKTIKIDTQFGSQGGQAYTESSFTNGLIRASRTQLKKVYFLNGHGERSLDDEKSEQSISFFKYEVEKLSYAVNTLNLLSTGQMPKDIDVLVIAGPQSVVSQTELQSLDNYLKAGGKIILALDRSSDVSWFNWLKAKGIVYKANYVFNVLNTQAGPVISIDQPTMANQFSSESDITKKFDEGLRIIFNKPSELKINPVLSEKHSYKPIVKSALASVALQSLTETAFEGKPQSYSLGFQIDDQMIVMSDVSVMANQFYPQGSNKDLLLSSLAYLAQEKDLISTSPKDISKTTLKMQGPELSFYFKTILVAYIIPLPLVFLFIALFVWYRRRHA